MTQEIKIFCIANGTSAKLFEISLVIESSRNWTFWLLSRWSAKEWPWQFVFQGLYCSQIKNKTRDIQVPLLFFFHKIFVKIKRSSRNMNHSFCDFVWLLMCWWMIFKWSFSRTNLKVSTTPSHRRHQRHHRRHMVGSPTSSFIFCSDPMTTSCLLSSEDLQITGNFSKLIYLRNIEVRFFSTFLRCIKILIIANWSTKLFPRIGNPCQVVFIFITKTLCEIGCDITDARSGARNCPTTCKS